MGPRHSRQRCHNCGARPILAPPVRSPIRETQPLQMDYFFRFPARPPEAAPGAPCCYQVVAVAAWAGTAAPGWTAGFVARAVQVAGSSPQARKLLPENRRDAPLPVRAIAAGQGGARPRAGPGQIFCWYPKAFVRARAASQGMLSDGLATLPPKDWMWTDNAPITWEVTTQ